MKAIKTYARQAYKNRYVYDRVTVDANGDIKGHWLNRNGTYLPSTKLGNLADCRTVKTDTGIRFYNRDFLVYTFSL